MQCMARRGFLRQSISLDRYGHLLRALYSDAREYSSRETASFDVCIVGAGVSGLATAIKLKQLCKEANKEVSVCILEKGSSVGAHVLSGCILETKALDELIPDWKEDETCPITCPVTKDSFYLLSRTLTFPLPKTKSMKNKGNYVVSLSEVTKWLGKKAEDLGVDIFPGFAAASMLYDGSGAVQGVTTGDFGIGKDGQRKPSFAAGMEIRSKLTFLAEGCRGSLSEQAMKRFNLREKAGCDHQTYALGIKEVWKVDPSRHQPGRIFHSIGYPLPMDVYGGGWLYHMSDNRVSVGLVTALDYSNPTISPYWEFQKFKKHPRVASILQDGECIQYGARCLNEGGLQSIPALSFPGGGLVGDSAGFLNVAKVKGVHTAMKSGIIAAENAFKSLSEPQDNSIVLTNYDKDIENSWIREELYRARNIRPGFSLFGGILGGSLHAAIDAFLFRGGAPWTLWMRKRMQDFEHLRPMLEKQGIKYPKPDNALTFDIPESLHRSGTNHAEDQPCHLHLVNPNIPDVVNYPIYGGPEQHYCPAKVYEYIEIDSNKKKLQINAQNCLHCKACDIKDPQQNIKWRVPEGSGGPKYTDM